MLVLEAGGTDEMDLVTNLNNWRQALGTDLYWNFVAEPNPHLNGIAIPYAMGKALGGVRSTALICIRLWRQPNITVLTGALATRICFNRRRSCTYRRVVDMGNEFGWVDLSTGVVNPIFTGVSPHGLIFLPTPEPATLTLLSGGFVGLLANQMMKKRR